MAAARLLIALTLAAPGVTRGASPSPAPRRLDLLILHACVLDGSGRPAFPADVGVRAGRIAALLAPGSAAARLARRRARRLLDARGLILAPGFIDLHSHSDAAMLADGGCCSELYEGVTTQVLGETAAVAVAGPLFGPALEPQQDLFAQQGVYEDWTSLAGYFARLEHSGIRVNVLTFATFGAIREAAMGLRPGPPTAAQAAREAQILRGAMRDGAFGLATAFSYPPDAFAADAEVIALARIAGRSGGIYATHVRGLDDPRVGGVAEAIAIARAAGTPLHIFHLQVARSAGPAGLAAVLARLRRARAAGLVATADAYPYRAAANGADSMLPAHFLEAGPSGLPGELRDPRRRGAILSAIAAAARKLGKPEDPDGWRELIVSSVARPEDAIYVGKTFAQMARLMRRPPADAVAVLLEREDGNFGRLFFNKSAASVREIIAQPWVAIGDDAVDLDLRDRSAFTAPHPRFFGTFPRVLIWARDEHLFTLAQAVRKMTSLPASILGLRDRGRIALGQAADLVIFDPAKISDPATYAHPWQYAGGMSDVLVNGVPVLLNGQLTHARPGKVLRLRRAPRQLSPRPR